MISGASGVGKSTVLKKVFSEREDLQFSVSATTRSPRPGEQEGVHYFFVSKETFEKMLAEDAFVEHSAHAANYYGTPKAQLEEKLKKGDVILDIEPNGAFQVQAVRSDAILIFIMPPSIEELYRRLSGRGDTSAEQIEIRMKRADWEISQSPRYHHIVVNDQVDTCAQKILDIIANTAD